MIPTAFISSRLLHLDPTKPLFLQIEASIQRGFGSELFYVKEAYICKEGAPIPANVVLLIYFINHVLYSAVTRYGPAELKEAGLLIVERTSLETTCTDRSNRRLVNASIYLFQYDLRVLHIHGKKNFVPDSLSRLEAPVYDLTARRSRPWSTWAGRTKYLSILKMPLIGGENTPITIAILPTEDAACVSKRGYGSC
ncbi:ribonuclease H [Fusarium oxysporum]|nr:ribonuclease H [Fusarium oxysporum]